MSDRCTSQNLPPIRTDPVERYAKNEGSLQKLHRMWHELLGRHHYNLTSYDIETRDNAKTVWHLVRKCRCGAVTPYSSEDE